MKPIIKLLLAFMTGCLAVTAFAQSFQITTYPLQYQQPGPRLIDGNVINGLIVRTNSAVCVSTPSLSGVGVVDSVFLVATQSYLVQSVSAVFAVANGSALTAQVTKDTDTAAPGAGTDLLTATFNLNATANTVQVGALVASNTTKSLAIGDRLSYDLSTAPAAVNNGIVITACLVPLAQN